MYLSTKGEGFSSAGTAVFNTHRGKLCMLAARGCSHHGLTSRLGKRSTLHGVSSLPLLLRLHLHLVPHPISVTRHKHLKKEHFAKQKPKGPCKNRSDRAHGPFCSSGPFPAGCKERFLQNKTKQNKKTTKETKTRVHSAGCLKMPFCF